MTVSAHPESQPQAEAYDAHPYRGRPCSDSHPSRLAVIARLAGVQTGDVRRCRVLELACGDGNNLIAIAESLPESSCVGIDLSERHIELGRAEVAALGLKNVTLQQGDLLSMTPGDAALGEFDFIIAHGFYSWVPRPVQDRLFAISRRHLAKNGALFVSYNLLPGWRIMQVFRDFLSFHARTARNNAERIQKGLDAAELLPLLTEGASSDMARFVGAYGRDFLRHLERLGIWRDQALIHDVIGDVNTPVYLSTFVNHASRFGLRYLGDAEFRGGVPLTLSESAFERLVPSVETPLDLEQYLDFARMRMFRQSLLCHGEVQPRNDPSPGDLDGLFVSSLLKAPKELDLKSSEAAEFTGEEEASLRTNHPLTKAALLTLAEEAPQALPFRELCVRAWARLGSMTTLPGEDVETLATYLLRAFGTGTKLVGLHAFSPQLTPQPGPRPKARGFARRQLVRGDEVTNLFHMNIGLDPLCRKLLPLLDGQRDVTALVAELSALGASGQLSLTAFGDPQTDHAAFVRALTAEVEEQVTSLARLGLLVP